MPKNYGPACLKGGAFFLQVGPQHPHSRLHPADETYLEGGRLLIGFNRKHLTNGVLAHFLIGHQ